MMSQKFFLTFIGALPLWSAITLLAVGCSRTLCDKEKLQQWIKPLVYGLAALFLVLGLTDGVSSWMSRKLELGMVIGWVWVVQAGFWLYLANEAYREEA